MIKKKNLLVFIFIIFGVGVGLLHGFFNDRDEMILNCKDCNLLMISLSDVSAENMSLYGYERITTPNLDKWAKDAFVFNNAFTHTSWTLPVGTSLFTSLYPYSHKVLGRFRENILDENIETLPEILRDEGYKTGAFTGGLDYDINFGHMRGFEEFEATNKSNNHDIPGIFFSGFEVALSKGLEWIEKNSNSKFFLFLHGYNTHCPFDPPEKVKGMFASREGRDIRVDATKCLRGYENSDDGNYITYYNKSGNYEAVSLTNEDILYLEELYDEEILAVDDSLESFFSNIDEQILEKTIIVILSDHGEMFARKGRFGRAGNIRGSLYEEVLNIPLIMKIPHQRGKRIDGLVQIIDIMPTILELLDVAGPKRQGKNLIPFIENNTEEINDYIFTGATFGLPQGDLPRRPFYDVESSNESVRDDEWKLIREVKDFKDGSPHQEIYELYNLKNDSEELNNLIDTNTSIAIELKRILQLWRSETIEYDSNNTSNPNALPEEIHEAARAGGYQ